LFNVAPQIQEEEYLLNELKRIETAKRKAEKEKKKYQKLAQALVRSPLSLSLFVWRRTCVCVY
jgi:hypothetical protein